MFYNKSEVFISLRNQPRGGGRGGGKSLIFGVKYEYKDPSFNDVDSLSTLIFENKKKGKTTREYAYRKVRDRFDNVFILSIGPPLPSKSIENRYCSNLKNCKTRGRFSER